MVSKRTPTTKDISLLQQLYKDGQLTLQPEFQRESVWPVAARAYLLDTILNDRPIPLLFFLRTAQLDTGRPGYAVVDGQQRLRAIFEFLDGRFGLSQTKGKALRNRRWKDLPLEAQTQILNYDLVIEEISGYSDEDIRDVFVRLNKYLVKLSPQELRHAREKGAFKDFVERIADWPFWQEEDVFSASQVKRMRPTEFAAEIAILLIEGPSDKKGAIDLYYERYRKAFPEGDAIEKRLKSYTSWMRRAIPQFGQSRYRRTADLYSLIGALDRVTLSGQSFGSVPPSPAGKALREFERELSSKDPGREATRYLAAASSHTNDLGPRQTRIAILERLIQKG